MDDTIIAVIALVVAAVGGLVLVLRAGRLAIAKPDAEVIAPEVKAESRRWTSEATKVIDLERKATAAEAEFAATNAVTDHDERTDARAELAKKPRERL